MLARLLEASPQKQIVWTSDYQGGPRPRRLKRPVSLARFQNLHDEKKLWLNALYTIYGDKNAVPSSTQGL